MTIEYPTKVSWVKELSDDVLSHYGTKTRKRLETIVEKSVNCGIESEILPLTKELIEWFEPYYASEISKKNNPAVFNIAKSTIDDPTKNYPYFISILTEKGQRVGASVFGLQEDRVSIAYRMFQHKWIEAKLAVGPSLFDEYLLSSYALKQGKEIISHGKDRNWYGQNASIGLAIYKLSAGYIPKVIPGEKFISVESSTIVSDSLIFHTPNDKNEITEASLFATAETLSKYERIHSSAENIHIQTTLIE